MFEAAFGATSVTGVILPLVSQGFRVVQRMWLGYNGWMVGPGGAVKLACRYATLARGLHDQLHPGGAFCASGNSGGAAEIAYALTRYDSGDVLDAAVLTSGPPLGRLDYGCLGATALPAWGTTCHALGVCQGGQSCGFLGPAAQLIDGLYGTTATDCQTQSPASTALWQADSVVSPAARLHYPKTELRFAFGGADCSEAVPLGRLYADAVTSAKQTTVVPGAPHGLPSVTAGAQQVLTDLGQSCVPRH